MSARVILTPTAEKQVAEAHEWWLEHRSEARTGLADEFEEALLLLAEHPKIGRAVDPPLPAGVRYWLLRRTKHHVFYRLEEDGRVVRILAVWNGERACPPLLGEPEAR